MVKFSSPDNELDKKFLAAEANTAGFDWKEVFFKPVPAKVNDDADNVIRILPARAGSGATYHMIAGKHFIKHGDNDIEQLVCMEETYGKPCPACQERKRIFEEDMKKSGTRKVSDTGKKAGSFWTPKKIGVFNVIDRLAYLAYKDGHGDLPKVKLWESPRKLCWEKIVRNVASKGRTSNLFDVYDDKDVVIRAGRDILVKFYPDSNNPMTMYDIQYLDAVPLGDAEEVAKWYEQIIDLIPEKIAIYQPIDYEEARLKCFGTKADRDALKEKKRKAYEGNAEKVEKTIVDMGSGTKEETKKEEPTIVPVEAAPAQKKEEPVNAPNRGVVTPAQNDLKAKIDEMRRRMQGGKGAA